MSGTAIKVGALGKRYSIGVSRQAYGTLRDALSHAVMAPVRRLSAALRPRAHGAPRNTIWALKDVSFDLGRGEVMGVIGRNGSGKSTLLKILSRITPPTEGRAEIRGRIGSLLEVGTGFHAELSGRDNVYLNGAILGMKRHEINGRFDEIVAFAEIGKFVDTPVKHYSSGMYMRLAFSVAAHLEPEILIVDEVLAVGDAEFQKRCLGKMQAVAQDGRTVLFVSHNMAAIQRLCTTALVLDEGRVLFNGSVTEGVARYVGTSVTRLQQFWPDISTAPGNDVVRLTGISLHNRTNQGMDVSVRDTIEIQIDYSVLTPGQQICVTLELLDAAGQALATTLDRYIERPWNQQPPHGVGAFRSTCCIPGDFLNEGFVGISIRIFSPPLPPNEAPHVRELNAIGFFVHDNFEGSGARGSFPHRWGVPAVRPWLRWQETQVGDPQLASQQGARSS